MPTRHTYVRSVCYSEDDRPRTGCSRLLRAGPDRKGNAMDQITAVGGGTAGLAAAQREGITFRSGANDCAAWHYQGSNGACVVMAGGAGVKKGPATGRFPARFHGGGAPVPPFRHP